MKHTQIGDSYIVSIERGEEIVSSLKRLCEEEDITLASVTGIGAAQQIELGYYNVGAHEYSTRTFDGEYEVAALVGNITSMDEQPYLHLHITIGDKDFAAYSGHLVEATVSGACEITLRVLDGQVNRYKDEKTTGLNLLQL